MCPPERPEVALSSHSGRPYALYEQEVGAKAVMYTAELSVGGVPIISFQWLL